MKGPLLGAVLGLVGLASGIALRLYFWLMLRHPEWPLSELMGRESLLRIWETAHSWRALLLVFSVVLILVGGSVLLAGLAFLSPYMGQTITQLAWESLLCGGVMGGAEIAGLVIGRILFPWKDSGGNAREARMEASANKR